MKKSNISSKIDQISGAWATCDVAYSFLGALFIALRERLGMKLSFEYFMECYASHIGNVMIGSVHTIDDILNDRDFRYFMECFTEKFDISIHIWGSTLMTFDEQRVDPQYEILTGCDRIITYGKSQTSSAILYNSGQWYVMLGHDSKYSKIIAKEKIWTERTINFKKSEKVFKRFINRYMKEVLKTFIDDEEDEEAATQAELYQDNDADLDIKMQQLIIEKERLMALLNSYLAQAQINYEEIAATDDDIFTN